MPVPQYVPFSQKLKPQNLREITGGMNPSEMIFELGRGARFVYFDYVISVLVMTYRRNSPVFFLKPGDNAITWGWRYAMLSFFFGWWGIPHGLICTPGAITRSLRGGHDISAKIKESLQAHMSKPDDGSRRL